MIFSSFKKKFVFTSSEKEKISKKKTTEEIKENKLIKKQEKKSKREQKRNEIKQIAYDMKAIKDLNDEWVETMAHIGLKNALDQTYALVNVECKPYGFSCEIHAPKGLIMRDIIENERNIELIQEGIKVGYTCSFMAKIKSSGVAIARFITKDIKSEKYKPLKLSPYELYLSAGLDGEPIITNMLDYPHVLITGSTGMGKTKFIDIILTNLISNTSSDEVSLFILQADKCDQIVYSDIKHCKGYAEKIEDMYAILKYILAVTERRFSILKPYMKSKEENSAVNNISDYNKAVESGRIKGEKWTCMYLVIDEYCSLMPEGEYDKEKQVIKKMIQSLMDRILQIGRSTGLYVILSTQRATIDKLPSFTKAMCNTVVSFRTNNRKSSEIALDTGEAVKLRKREFITKIEEVFYGKTLELTQGDLCRWIKPYTVSNAPNIDYSAYSDLGELLNQGKGRNPKPQKKDKRAGKMERELVKQIMEAKSKVNTKKEKSKKPK